MFGYKDFVNINEIFDRAVRSIASIVRSVENLTRVSRNAKSFAILASFIGDGRTSERASESADSGEPGEEPGLAEVSAGKMATIVNLCLGGTGYTK